MMCERQSTFCASHRSQITERDVPYIARLALRQLCTLPYEPPSNHRGSAPPYLPTFPTAMGGQGLPVYSSLAVCFKTVDGP